MFSKKLYIFDLDGTLVDAYTAIWKSLNFTLRKLNYPKVSFQNAKKNVGKGDRLFMQVFFKKGDINRALVIYRGHHKGSLKVYSRLRPGAKKLVSDLKRKNKKVAIASNRPRYFTNIILKTLGLNNYVDYILCADEINSLKPNPKILNVVINKLNVEKKQAVFIGDMTIDLETAKRARMDAVFVRGGSSVLSEIKKYKNVIVARSLNDVVKI